MERTSAPYHAALRHLGDATRDGAHAPKLAQFRIEMREAVRWITARVPRWMASRVGTLVALPIRVGLRLWEIVLLSFVIQWGILPLLAGDFHRVSLHGPISNIPAVILTGAIVPLGFLALAASYVWGAFAAALAKGVGLGIGLLLESVSWFSRMPHTSYRIPGPPLWLAVGFVAALVMLAGAAGAALHARQQNRHSRHRPAPPIAFAEWSAAVALLALTALIATYPFAPSVARGKLEVSVLDVGQGDSSFIAFPDGRTLLIDGGGLAGSERIGGYRSGFDVGEEVVSPYLWSRGIKNIDAIALTHGDHDHIDGLYSVIENFGVRELWIGREEERPAFTSLLAEAQQRGVRVVHRLRGDRYDWDGATGEFLSPLDSSPWAKPSNDDSLVLRITDGARHFLFTGDIQERAERELVNNGAALASDFLKVPHHGSKTSSSERFLANVAPRVAVISVGEANPFGQPAEVVLERYSRDGVRLLRTDRYGEVTVQTDGKSLEVSTFAAGDARLSESARAEGFSSR